MIRRLARERKEYIYRKSLEGKEKVSYEKKRKIWQALQDGKTIPTELRDDELELRREMELEGDPLTAPPTSHVDDEYARVGLADPKVFLTTSRDPSSRLIQFAKGRQEVRLIFPHAQRVNRGNHVIRELVDACRANDVTDIVVLHEHRGEPGVLRHDIKSTGTVSEAYPHLIFHNFTTPLGERALFPVPKDEAKRVITFANQNDYISFRHHIYEKEKDSRKIELKEMGPRFEMRLYQIKLGTIDISEAENEWVLRPYLNTAKKKDAL